MRILENHTEKKKFSSSFKFGEDLTKVAVKEADRQASRLLKMRPSKTKKMGYPYFRLPLDTSRASRLYRDNQPAVFELHHKADDGHGHGQRFAEVRTH